jgi:predicted MFS family arabinose efflux permease
VLRLLLQRNFALLWWAGLISRSGGWLLTVALPVYVYEETGSTLATGAMFVAQGVPFVLLGPIAGVFADRWDRKRTMVIADLLRAALLLLLLLVRYEESVWLVYVVAFFQAAIGLFFGPAENALLPRLVRQEQLTAANSLNTINDSIPRLAGPPIGGLLLTMLGLSSVALLDSASFLISAAMIGVVSVPSQRQEEQDSDDGASVKATAVSAWAGVWRDLAAGLRLIRRNRTVGAIFAGVGVADVGEGIVNALLVVFVAEALGGGGQEYGWVLTARGIGGLAGSLAIGYLGARVRPERLLPLGLMGTGLLMVAMWNLPVMWASLSFMALIGVAVMAWAIPLQTMLQTNVADEYRGRVFGAYVTTVELLALVGIGLGGAMADVLGILPLLDAGGILYALGGLIALALLPKKSQPRRDTA